MKGEPWDDLPPETVPMRREADGRICFAFSITYGPYTAVLFVRQHPGTKDATLALGPS